VSAPYWPVRVHTPPVSVSVRPHLGRQVLRDGERLIQHEVTVHERGVLPVGVDLYAGDASGASPLSYNWLLVQPWCSSQHSANRELGEARAHRHGRLFKLVYEV
jgi:hypothetical protein